MKLLMAKRACVVCLTLFFFGGGGGGPQSPPIKTHRVTHCLQMDPQLLLRVRKTHGSQLLDLKLDCSCL